MSLNKDNLTVFTKKWFDGTPQNADYATQTYTVTSTPVATETVTVGTDVYEFVADAGDIAEATNIPVILAATPSADNFVTTLADAINTQNSVLTAVASTPDDTVVLTYDTVGTEGNAVATTTTCVNGSFGGATLTGGQYATPCRASQAIIEISGTRYMASKPVDEWSTTGWS